MFKPFQLTMAICALTWGTSAFQPAFADDAESSSAAVSDNADNAEGMDVINDLPDDLKKELSDQEDETPIANPCGPSSVDSQLLREIYHQYLRVNLKKGPGNRKSKKALEAFHCARDQYTARLSNQAAPSVPAWSIEELTEANGSSYQVTDFLDRFEGWAKGTLPMSAPDQALNFAASTNNKLELFIGHEPYHEALFKDLNGAKDSINMQMFGILADDYGWSIAKVLAEKAKAGLKVRFLTDKFGARLTFLNKVPKDRDAGPIEPLLKFLQDSGVEVLISYDHPTRGLLNYDHRKAYIVDGQIGWSTGYTIENAMRHKVFDQGTRIHGDLTRQMQATYFASWLAFGGKLSELADSRQNFLSRYFPEPSELGSAKVRLLDNIPRTQQPITEGYYKHIENAKKQVMVTNLYFADTRLAKALLQAKKNGADVTIIVQEQKSLLYTQFANFFFRKFQKAGIHAYWFKGEEGYGMSHAKVVLADDYVSSGSCNFDLFSLYHQGEQNIETEDPAYVDAIRNQFFTEALKYSYAYERPKGFFKNLGVSIKGLLSEAYGIFF